MKERDIRVMEKFALEIVSPVMVEYTKWVISMCQKKGIKKVYFLARDGYLLHLIADKICKHNNLDIEVRYLYCSRYSLRMPSFHMIGNEKYDVLFLRSCRCTPNTILKRAGLNDTEIDEIIGGLGIEKNKILDNGEFESIKNRLINNPKFNEILDRNSTLSYENAIKYFTQEKLFDDDIVIVDSGWTGSMQRSIRQLADSVGYKGKIIGFYFGMFKQGKSEDGEYLTYYFDAKSNKKRKTNFNNNLFECMLSANHGMTLGYDNMDGRMVPILQPTKEDDMSILVQTQIDTVVKFVDENKSLLTIYKFDKQESAKSIYKILKRAMIYPTREEVDMLSNIYFCDDVTGEYQIPLVDKDTTRILKQNLILPQIFRKVLKRKNTLEKVYWPYGVIAYMPKILRPWYRFNFKFMYFIRYTFFNK